MGRRRDNKPVTNPNRLAYRADFIGLVGVLGVASLPGHIPKMGVDVSGLESSSQRVLYSIYKTLFWDV